MNFKKYIPTVFILLFCLSSSGQTSAPFPNLTKVVVDTSFQKIIFGYDAKTTKLLKIKCRDLSKNDHWYCDTNNVDWEIEKVAQYYSDKIKDTLEILFDEGPCDDPGFTISKKKDHKLLGWLSATEMYINSLGVIYTCGHTNNMFNTRRKYQLFQDTVIENKQPYHYVGLKSKTTKPLTLYRNKTGNETVAKLSVGYEVEILLCDVGLTSYERYYLIRTDFGIVGWMRLEGNDPYYDTPIDGFYYTGD